MQVHVPSVEASRRKLPECSAKISDACQPCFFRVNSDGAKAVLAHSRNCKCFAHVTEK
jgi:hypothetical protein